MRLDVHVRIEILDAVARGVELAAGRSSLVPCSTWRCRFVDVDDVEVDEAERADAGGGEIERGWRAEPARADEQHARALELLLPLETDLGEDEVAAVAEDLLVRELGMRRVAVRGHRLSLRRWRGRW